MTEFANKTVLLVDDEPAMRMALAANFERTGWTVETACGVTEALQKVQANIFPLVVTDVRMPDGNGLQVMRAARTASANTAVILLTAYGTVSEAVQAIQGGACDYLTKPVSFDLLQSAVERVMTNAKRPVQVSNTPSNRIIGNSPALLHALQRAANAAAANADVLVEAESGTGKELLARYIHDQSSRRQGPFVAVNCAALPEHLLESELFGHVRGAFTGATVTKPGKFDLADGGTLLLDEIGEMPLVLQPKLLRVLQERECERLGDTKPRRVNVRVIATTNAPLLRLVEEGRFRLDLYYRLNVIPLTLPPLRQRREDIPQLAQHFAEVVAAHTQQPVRRLLPEFVLQLQRQSWPGNVRELGNFIRRVLTLTRSEEIGIEHFSAEFVTNVSELRVERNPMRPGTAMRELERQLLQSTLEATHGNRTHAAEMLGVSLRTIRNKIREYGLPPRRFA
ncbi:MAG: sigma-54-dependent Fis family transcriptional regulator [Acidobacteria bacterium]|nr:sigma-54-dependent Fis family transcriptional regulator [Acidobacteriota bacterium]